ncbi:hypothetical protein GCM10010145_62290 [Streptomyces ruber]|uniref:Uncharacterized protein n=2 Tax=Streptomyces TaxID=1883 RepID=A0A918BQ14_9ACTN|nr:hypothetical protein [Streptomyces ruber]GGQ84187.1 hypothetical protein GCM10010145_62290 [Streptomyces ruber]
MARYDPASTPDPFAASTNVFTALAAGLNDPRTGRLAHHELEELLDHQGRLLLRQLLQDHLDLRARREEEAARTRPPVVTGPDHLVRSRLEPGHPRRPCCPIGDYVALRGGVDRDVVQRLWGHLSPLSMERERLPARHRCRDPAGRRARTGPAGTPVSRILRLSTPPVAPGRTGWDSRAWLAWLQDRLNGSWRPGEWDGRHRLFTGDLASPRTSSATCRTRACDIIVITRRIFCSPRVEQL